MSEILDVMAVAIQQLYISCVERQDFPGKLSAAHLKEMHDNELEIPTTHAILEGLGLIKARRTKRPDAESSDEDDDDNGHSVQYWHDLKPIMPLQGRADEPTSDEEDSIYTSADLSSSKTGVSTGAVGGL
ncbi:MAG: hypothetical protein Q9227_001338 [Pyrenula ochraceoflavens]